MPRKIRVLVVDDSTFVRKAIVRMLSSDPQIGLIETASDGMDGYAKAVSMRPDVITLDVKMPGMDGLTALRKIMADCPAPVLMLSSLTSEGGEITLKALDLGAVDVIDKSTAHTAMDILSLADELLAKVKALAGVDAAKIARKVASKAEVEHPVYAASARGTVDAVVIGASTGGPPALQEILSKLPADINAPLLVVQHMPLGFTASLSERLNNLSPVAVSEAHDGCPVLPGHCIVAPSGLHMTLESGPDGLRARLSKEPQDTLHRPSVDVLMRSAAEVLGAKAMGVILTGMGSDGAAGLKAMHEAGARTVAQDEDTCVVYGMPRVAVEVGAVDCSLPLEKIAGEILKAAGRA